jgi:heptosyltransferase-2
MCALKKLIPDSCSFYVAAPASYLPLFQSIPWIDHIVSLGTGHSKWTKEQISEVKKLNAGVGFLFVNSLRSAYYLKQAKVKKLFGASNGLRNLLLSRHYKVSWHTKAQYGSTHQAYKYLAMAQAMGAPEWDGKFPDFQLKPPENQEFLELKKHKNILAIHPGAAYGPTKKWPAKNFSEVCRHWITTRKGKIVVLGLANEFDTASEIIKGLPEENVINLVGKTALADLMSVLKNADICICNDSGTMHLAGALNVKGIAIFGSTDPYSTGPLGNKWIVLLNKQSCSPCFSRICKNPQKDYKCLKSITPENVIAAINTLIHEQTV